MNDGKSDDYIYGGDPTLWADVNINQESSNDMQSDQELVWDETPLYPNQLEDPDNTIDYYYNFWFNELEWFIVGCWFQKFTDSNITLQCMCLYLYINRFLQHAK